MKKSNFKLGKLFCKKLQEHLGTKRYLLVLGDVWDEERDKWDSFVNSLSGISSATGNYMIVTTRSQVVASIVKTLRIHELENLSGDDCRSIIKAKAFINSGDIPMEFETVGRNIAERCRGLPLAAKVVGGLLHDKSKDEWQEIEINSLSDFGNDQNTISKILKLSFDHLSPSLKKCFAYCSIFPKGYRIEKEQLIELWMAEGFLQTETTVCKIFNLLLQNSLLQVVERDDYGNVTHCNMHDLVHDLAFSVLCENDNVKDGICQRRYIGYESGGDGLLSIPKG
ncbi:putative disease resistance protein rga3 [Phtheirospermum japonicum]|uniref:Putative disease resistance protein rga3 n=1 Tax=Phtheirospermum japonicum TaxID=374723 RepID=A0A830BLB7_9LAMI|nr:putative disease resistance protein rga3 [Phtheirospermum japonicum]